MYLLFAFYFLVVYKVLEAFITCYSFAIGNIIFTIFYVNATKIDYTILNSTSSVSLNRKELSWSKKRPSSIFLVLNTCVKSVKTNSHRKSLRKMR